MRTGLLASALAATLLALVSFTVEASANTVEGTWQSSSGNQFEVRASMRRGGFRLRLTSQNGTPRKLRGDWVQGMEGTQFEYWDGPHRYVGTFSPRDPNRVRVSAANGTVTWWRRYVAPPPPSRGSKIFGTWRSSSGNVFHVREAQDGGFLLSV